MMNSIIYYRKSTDRDDLQANSLEHQLNNCRGTASLHNLMVVKEIGESRSAKEEYTREGFNEMIQTCKKGKIDFIIIDEPKRLSRNNIDTSRIIDLMDKKQIKGIIATSRQYMADNSRDKFLLQLDLSLSKMDNEDRAKDIKDKMRTCAKKGMCLWKAAIGYKNITLSKSEKAVIIDPIYGPIIKKAFELRAKGYSYSLVGDYLYSKGIRTGNCSRIRSERAKRILQNKFYMGITYWDGEEFEGKHPPLISKELYLKANRFGEKGYIKNLTPKYLLTGLVKEESGKTLKGYMRKGKYIYYKNVERSEVPLNISEQKLFNMSVPLFDKKEFNFPEGLEKLTSKVLKEMYLKAQNNIDIDTSTFLKEKQSINEKKSVLVDRYLDGDIEKSIYHAKLREFDTKILEIDSKIESTKKKIPSGLLEKTKEVVELVSSLYRSYLEASNEKRSQILKMYRVELLLNSKKELQLAENKLLKLLQKINLHIWWS